MTNKTQALFHISHVADVEWSARCNEKEWKNT